MDPGSAILPAPPISQYHPITVWFFRSAELRASVPRDAEPVGKSGKGEGR